MAGQRFSKSGLTFSGVRTLLAWLKSPCGAEVREALERESLMNLEQQVFTTEEGRRLQEQVIERHEREQRVVVDCEPLADGRFYLRVYGPPSVKVAVVTRPKVPNTPEWETATEQLVEVELPKSFRRVFAELRLRKSEVVEAVDVGEWIEREQAKEFRKLVYDAVKETVKQ